MGINVRIIAKGMVANGEWAVIADHTEAADMEAVPSYTTTEDIKTQVENSYADTVSKAQEHKDNPDAKAVCQIGDVFFNPKSFLAVEITVRCWEF